MNKTNRIGAFNINIRACLVAAKTVASTPLGIARPIASGVVGLVLGFATLQTPAFAQTDFQIKASSANLESEYLKELDKWMLNAYEGDKDAQFKVGVLFSNDQFSEPDHEQASYWYTQAARQGHVLAQYNLGHQYLTGTGVKRDEKAAMQWWLKAAEQQHPLAQFNVGRAYYLGIGLDKDLSQAKLWFQRASQNKEPKSTELLKQLGWWEPDADVEQAAMAVMEPASTNSGTPELRSSRANESAGESQAMTLTQSTVDEAITIADDNVLSAEAVKTSDSKTPSRGQADINAVAVFTNPAVRSVLITIENDASALTVLEKNSTWTVVQNRSGFPIWVSENFVRERGNMGTITANSVNARSVPLITKGSVIGRLEKNEQLMILDRRDDWYRLRAPSRFKGWVKTADLTAALTPSLDPPASEVSQVSEMSDREHQAALQELASDLGVSLNDNEWLFEQIEDDYALQLASFKSLELVERFVKSLPADGISNLRLFTTSASEGGQWTYLVYGRYSDSEAAKQARTDLKQRRAWVRRMGKLQQNRCLAWKKQVPAPKELNQYCI